MERKCGCHQVYEECAKGLEMVYVQFWVSVTEGTVNDVLQDIIGVYPPSSGRQFEMHVCDLSTNHPLFPFYFHGINDIFVNCNWVATRWQQYSTHLHTNSTQNDTQQTIHRTTQKFWKSMGRALFLQVLPWHLPYN
jgi:hypothetical protein